MILTTELEERLRVVAEHHINIFHLPEVEKRSGLLPRNEEIHFIYPLSRIAGNAADGNSLHAMQDALSAVMNRRVGTVWVGIHGDKFHVWAAYRDE